MNSIIISKLITLPGIIVGLAFHEAAHAKMSDLLGDPTPRNQGRVTINPFAHIDPFGLIALILFGFGWGKPVQINPGYYKNRRRDEFLVGIAGVITNLIIAIIFAQFAKLAYSMYGSSGSKITEILFYLLYYTVVINLSLMVFNLLPIPPLDGFGLVTQIFKLDTKPWYGNLMQYSSFILIAFVLLNGASHILTPLVSAMMKILM